MQERNGDAGFFLNALGGEQVEILALVVAVLEVAGFDQAFVDQGFEAVVGFAQADSQVCCEFSLAYLGVGFQVAQEF